MTSRTHLRTRFTGGLLAAVLATAMSITVNSGAAVAADTRPAPAAVAESAECATASAPATAASATDSSSGAEMTLVDPAAAAAAVDRVTAVAAAEGITAHTAEEFIDRDAAKVYAIDIDGVTATSVTFPLTGAGFAQPSNLTFVMDADGRLSQYSESTVVERGDGMLDLTTYRDGALVHSAEFDTRTAAGFGSGAVTAAVDPTTCLMAVLGVSSIVAGTILILCGGSCSVPVTPPTATICAACIGGIALVGGASITAVMGCFNGG